MSMFSDVNTVVPTPDPALQPSQICRSGYAAYLQGCYKLVKSPRTWEAARTFCTAEGGDLVSMHSAAENSIVQMLAALADGGLWIGMSKNEVVIIFCLHYLRFCLAALSHKGKECSKRP